MWVGAQLVGTEAVRGEERHLTDLPPCLLLHDPEFLLLPKFRGLLGADPVDSAVSGLLLPHRLLLRRNACATSARPLPLQLGVAEDTERAGLKASSAQQLPGRHGIGRTPRRARWFLLRSARLLALWWPLEL